MPRRNLLIVSGLVISILTFAIVVQGSEPEWRPLAEQEKISILAEITERLGKLRSVSVSFEWKDGELKKNGTEEITGEYHYFEVFDDHRHYLKQSLEQISKPDGTTNSEESKFIPIVERSWNGVLMRTFDHRSGTGAIRGKVPYFKGAEVMVFSIIGRDYSGQSWIKRYQNRDVTGIDYDVEINAENEHLVKVTERPKNLTPIYARQTFIFDRTKDLAITRCYLENVNQTENKVWRLSDIRFEDFRQIEGFYIPFKISRIAESPTFDLTGVQYITVKEVTVNDDSHEKFLRTFTFPRNANLYDYILGRPIHINAKLYGYILGMLIYIGVDGDEPSMSLCRLEQELTVDLVQGNSDEKVDDSAIPKDQEGSVRTFSLIAVGLILILAGVVAIVLKKRRSSCGVITMICCCVLFGSNAFAQKTKNHQLYGPGLLDDLTPEHRAIHEKDLARLCGINCLYQVYLCFDTHPLPAGLAEQAG